MPETGLEVESQDDPSAALGYRESHNGVLWRIWERKTGPGQPALDFGAVVVPTCRDLTGEVPGLEFAADIAEHYDRPLIVFLSKDAAAEDFPEHVKKRLGGTRLSLVDMRSVASAWKPQLESARHPVSRLRRDNDVGAKRNLGLTLGIASAWQTLLFIDDDISPMSEGDTLSPASIDHALRLMHTTPSLKAVGWAADDFPDNSVIGHARRDTGLVQDVFVGGGAQLIRCEPGMPFSPDVYNEDWLQTLSLLNAASGRKDAVGFGGHVLQVPYDPYTRKRAASEEAGDLIAEALMNVFEQGVLTSPAALSVSFWRASLRVRQDLIRELFNRVPKMDGLPAERRAQIHDSLRAALDVSRSLRPSDVRQYLQALCDDDRRWAEHLNIMSGKAYGRDISPSPEVPLKDLVGGMPPSWLSNKTLRLRTGVRTEVTGDP